MLFKVQYNIHVIIMVYLNAKLPLTDKINNNNDTVMGLQS